MKLQFVSNKRNKFGIRGFSLGIADGVAEKSLQSVQIATIPGHFDGVSDCTLYSAWRGLEGLCHLGIQYLGDGIDDVHIVDGDDDSLPQVLIALDVGRDADGFITQFMALMLSCLLS